MASYLDPDDSSPGAMDDGRCAGTGASLSGRRRVAQGVQSDLVLGLLVQSRHELEEAAVHGRVLRDHEVERLRVVQDHLRCSRRVLGFLFFLKSMSSAPSKLSVSFFFCILCKLKIKLEHCLGKYGGQGGH